MLLTKRIIDYYNSLEQLFNNPAKFEILNEDPTLRNLSTIQGYLNTLELSAEITKDKNKKMRHKLAQMGTAHGLPKIHKQFFKVTSFRPVVDTATLRSWQISNKSFQYSNTKGIYS